MDREQANSRLFKGTSHFPGPIPCPRQAVSGSRPRCSLDACSFSVFLCKSVLSRVCRGICDLLFKGERTKVKTSVLMEKQIARPDGSSLSPAQTVGWPLVGIVSPGEVHCSAAVWFSVHSSYSVEGCRCEAAVFKVTSHTFAQDGRPGLHLCIFPFSFLFLLI